MPVLLGWIEFQYLSF